MRIVILLLAILLTNSVYGNFPDSYLMEKDASYSKSENIRTRGKGGDHKVGGNFILDIVQKAEVDDSLFVATGDGLSVGTGLADEIEDYRSTPWFDWDNTVLGDGGSSAISFSNDQKALWMTTATSEYKDDVDAFVQKGTGVHLSLDNGQTWSHYEQPGLTPYQGLTYDIACDTLGSVWMACFGQSIQKAAAGDIESWQSLAEDKKWKTLVPDDKEWSPVEYMNHRVFSVHHSLKNKLWVGTADGINLCKDYSVADEQLEWIHFRASQTNGLSGNFVTSIASQAKGEGEVLWVASWVAEGSNEIQGVSYTADDGQNWKQCLLGEKIYNFGFKDDLVFACATSGLWKSADGGENWEKYEISVYSPLKEAFLDIGKVYSFNYYADKMWLGTGVGLAVSSDEGNNWVLIDAYKEANRNGEAETYAYPNPFSPRGMGKVKIQFGAEKPGKVECTIYNFAMEKVVEITTSRVNKTADNNYYLTWDGRDSYHEVVANGVYFYEINADGKKSWNKIIVFE